MEKYLGYIDKAVQLAKLKEQIEQCTKCRNLVESRKLYPYGKPTFGYGNPNSKIVFIGEAPGHLGCGRTGKPFMGDRSGEIYFKALKESGLEYDQVYTTNVVKCCPLNNRTPTKEEVAHCAYWLETELKIINPKVIIALGRTAANRLGIKDNLNKVLLTNYRYEGRLVKVLYHPAYPLRCGSQAVLQWLSIFKLTIKGLSEYGIK
jgi:DNA polymerase